MAEEEAKEAEEVEAAEGEEDEAPKKGKKKLIILVVGVLLLGGIVYFALSFLGILGGEDPIEVNEVKKQDEVTIENVAYYDLPAMVVNLVSNGKRKQYLKVRVSLEFASKEASEAIQPFLPRVEDLFQTYLRTLRAEDLEGSASVYRLKEELLKRINLTVQPSHVNRVLFKEIIVQ